MYTAASNRYDSMKYNRCGKSGLLLPAISLGLWQNFGNANELKGMQAILVAAFDKGITHFDLANNYGPPAGEAERNFGKILSSELSAYRDELIISTKAGYYMWPGPYGDWGSKKYLTASIDQSLKRMGLEYVDIFYSHRPDPNTAIEETMQALDQIVRSGKALYAGISNYSAAQTKQAAAVLKTLGTPCVIHQPRYSLLDRWVEKKTTSQNESLLDVVGNEGMGCIVFSPLAQGRLTDKYLNGIPADSRVGRSLPNGAILPKDLNEEMLGKISQLNALAVQRNQSLAQMAIAWLLKDERVTSVLMGASSVAQLHNSLDALTNLSFTAEELLRIEEILESK
ncbi:L-glyceraldehyde 3-phosphate reductase [Lacibacter luteus]|uniref:L-glyceraldehyde 3-phosphate reductase n=1 Tax=Lacibacter luteus TaxID=2508719 RepID=A0A4Q1CE97_9BACT|nr:L-glyceraldehyde 3-phosphate reductase [Lacibacter luteus]RXK57756.1 L-glyceraldehyde 3-phosphate reductase [Lacibacter luteus]